MEQRLIGYIVLASIAYNRTIASAADLIAEKCVATKYVAFLYRGGFRHVQHVRPNRGPTKRGPPQARDCRTPARHFLTCGVGHIYVVLRHLKHVSTECFCTLMSENLCEGRAPTFLPNRVLSSLNPALLCKNK